MSEVQGRVALVTGGTRGIGEAVSVALKNAGFGYVLQVGRVAVEGSSAELRENKEVIESYMGG